MSIFDLPLEIITKIINLLELRDIYESIEVIGPLISPLSCLIVDTEDSTALPPFQTLKNIVHVKDFRLEHLSNYPLVFIQATPNLRKALSNDSTFISILLPILQGSRRNIVLLDFKNPDLTAAGNTMRFTKSEEFLYCVFSCGRFASGNQSANTLRVIRNCDIFELPPQDATANLTRISPASFIADSIEVLDLSNVIPSVNDNPQKFNLKNVKLLRLHFNWFWDAASDEHGHIKVLDMFDFSSPSIKSLDLKFFDDYADVHSGTSELETSPLRFPENQTMFIEELIIFSLSPLAIQHVSFPSLSSLKVRLYEPGPFPEVSINHLNLPKLKTLELSFDNRGFPVFGNDLLVSEKIHKVVLSGARIGNGEGSANYKLHEKIFLDDYSYDLFKKIKDLCLVGFGLRIFKDVLAIKDFSFKNLISLSLTEIIDVYEIDTLWDLLKTNMVFPKLESLTIDFHLLGRAVSTSLKFQISISSLKALEFGGCLRLFEGITRCDWSEVNLPNLEVLKVGNTVLKFDLLNFPKLKHIYAKDAYDDALCNELTINGDFPCLESIELNYGKRTWCSNPPYPQMRPMTTLAHSVSIPIVTIKESYQLKHVKYNDENLTVRFVKL